MGICGGNPYHRIGAAEMETKTAGKIRSLYRYPEKKQPAVQEGCLILEENLGIRGDCHSDGSDRQISLLDVSAKAWMESQEIKGFCFTKFKENILLEDSDIPQWKPGIHIKAGTAELVITKIQKHCYPEMCNIAKSGCICRLQGSSCFARVVRSGIMKVGDKIEMEE